jgi:hypothetical protein
MGSPRAQAALWSTVVRESIDQASTRDRHLDELGSESGQRVVCEWIEEEALPTFRLATRTWSRDDADFVQFSLDAQGNVRIACSDRKVRLNNFVVDPASDEDAHLRGRELVEIAIRILIPVQTSSEDDDDFAFGA